MHISYSNHSASRRKNQLKTIILQAVAAFMNTWRKMNKKIIKNSY